MIKAEIPSCSLLYYASRSEIKMHIEIYTLFKFSLPLLFVLLSPLDEFYVSLWNSDEISLKWSSYPSASYWCQHKIHTYIGEKNQKFLGNKG